MGLLATWEKLLLGVIGLLVLFWFSPGVKTMIAQSREAQKDWPAVLIPAAGGHWFNPSRAHHFTLCIQRPVAVLSDCLPQEYLLDTLMTQLRSRNGYDPKARHPV